MAKFAVIFTLLVIAYIGLLSAAPVDQHANQGGFRNDMAEKFIDFIKHDQQLSSLLSEDPSTHAKLVRIRRDDDVESIDGDTITANTEGFFDRAARFVMEVLQRFLRWINTDD